LIQSSIDLFIEQVVLVKKYNQFVIISQLQKSLLDFCHLDPTLPLLVGVSGGPDSLCLMDALHRLGWKPVVACFDHGLRLESSEEVQFVQAAAGERGLPFVIGGSDVRAFASKEKLSLEEAARIARYKFLFEQANQFNAQAVAVAHTADDQVETVLMHFLRGTGLAGLKGMAFRSILAEWDINLPLVRPLIGSWREEVLGYCQEQGLQPVMDISNQDITYLRNRLRHELIPTLQKYNPRVKSAIWRMAQSLAGDFADLEKELDELESTCLLEMGDGFTVISYPAIKALSSGMKRNLLRRVTARLRPGLRDIDFEALERALTFIQSPTRSKKIDWIGGLLIFLDKDKFVISCENGQFIANRLPQLESPSAILCLPGYAVIGNGWQLEADTFFTTNDKWTFDREDPFNTLLDADRITLPLIVRSAKPGERFKPLGMEGHSLKLSNFFINVRLPQRMRQYWPIIFSGEEIAWVPGYRPAHVFRVTDQTCRVIQLRLIRTD
jgi:tRNA(Ile)-lysidine synthase